MSLKLIIADDEYFIRQRIKKIVPWENLNLEFVGEAENGKQVIELLKEFNADIILLDIKMPQMNGIETAEYIKKYYPHIHIIVLSGYNDFEYARTALHHGVKEYLLKPLETKALETVLTECIRSIQTESQAKNTIKLYQHYKLCSSLANVRNGMITYTDFCIKYPEFSHFFFSIYVSIYFAENSGDTSIEVLANILRNAGFFCEYTQESDYIYILQIFLEDRKEAVNIDNLFTEFVNNQNSYTFLYIENIFSVKDNWKIYYSRCMHLLTQRYFATDSSIYISFSSTDEGPYQDEILKVRQNLIAALNTYDSEIILTYFNKLFSSIEKRKSSDYLSLVITEIFIVYYVNFHVPDNLMQNITEFSSYVIESEYSLKNLKTEVFSYALECIEKSNSAPSDVILCRKIVEYIGKHYKEQSLSVARLSSKFQLHPSYLGSVFKKVSRTSLLQYISHIRISAAQKLLSENNLKVSEIAKAVGYSDVYYFSKKFKKSCGCSPKDYALNHQRR